MDKMPGKLPKGQNPLSQLSAQIDLRLDRFSSREFYLEDIEYNITAAKGIYDISSSKSILFGDQGTGTIRTAPFNDPPWFKVNYQVENFSLD